MKTRGIMVAVVLTLAAAPAGAYELDELLIESWTGTGDNAVVLVVDFWPYNGSDDSFAFGCRFGNAQINGLELLDALHNANNGFTYAHTSGFVTDFWYVKDQVEYHTGYHWPDSYWSYWLSADFGENWEYSPVGPADRTLADGDADGWLARPGNDPDSQPVTPLAPPMKPGDLNCDDLVDFGDINPFVLALTNPAGYEQLYPGCDIMNGDINEDGLVDFSDINPFIDLLTQP